MALDSQKLLQVKRNIDAYLLKNDESFRRMREQERKLIDQRNQLGKDYKELLTSVNSLFSKFDGSVSKLGDSVNQSLVAAVGSVLTALNSGDTQAFLKQLKKEDSELAVSLLSELKAIQTALVNLKFPQPPDIPKQFSFVEAKELKSQIVSVEKAIKQIRMPDLIVPNSMSVVEAREIINQLKSVERTIKALPNNMPKTVMADSTNSNEILTILGNIENAIRKLPRPDKFEFPDSISIDNFPPQKIPQPVTNININPLRGLVHTSTTTVGSSMTPLPSYGVLENRRSLIFYNTSASVTVYIGGSNITASNGLPIATSSYSPSFDSGPRQIWYGITSSGTADVRCAEISNDSGL